MSIFSKQYNKTDTKNIDNKDDSNYIIINSVVDGDIIAADAHIVLQKQASIKGDVKGRIVDINSKVNGNIFATENVILRENSTINGDIQSKNIVIKEGATGRGQINTQKGNSSEKKIKEIERIEMPKPNNEINTYW